MAKRLTQQVWNQLHIKVLDIRLLTLAAGESSCGYRLPASAFLFPYRGKAKVWMDELLHPVEHFHFFHGCKGMRLDIEAEEYFEYYLVLYRAEFPLRRRLSLVRGEIPPFQQIFAFAPAHATFSIMEETDKTLSLFGKNYGRGGQAIYGNLARIAPESYAETIMEQNYQEISKESLEQYAGDYVILTTEKSLEEIRQDTFWGRLDAVKNDRLYVWPNKRSYFVDPLSVLSQTEELADWLTGTAQKH